MIGFSISSTLTYAITGGLSDVFDRRAFLILGGLVSIVGLIMAMAVNTMPMMVASMVVQGLGSGASQLA
jgi:MFS family permease